LSLLINYFPTLKFIFIQKLIFLTKPKKLYNLQKNNLNQFFLSRPSINKIFDS